MPVQNIKIGMDLSDVKGQSAEFIAALQAQEEGVIKLFEKMSILNKQGEVTRKVIAGIDEEGNKFQATLKKMGDGWDILEVKVKKATSALQDLKKAQAEAARAEGFKNASAGEAILGSAFNTSGQQLGSSAANSVDTSIQKIKSTLADGSVSVQRFQELLAQFQANPRGLMPNLTEEESKIVRSFRSIQGAIEAASAARQKAADDDRRAAQKTIDAAQKAMEIADKQRRAAADLRNRQSGVAQFDLFAKGLSPSSPDLSKLDPSRLAQVESAFARVRAMIEAGSISFQRFKELYDQVSANPKQIIPGLNGNEQRAVDTIRSLGKELEGTGKKAEDAGFKMISLGGILRLLEAQLLKRVFSVLENEMGQAISQAAKFSIQIAEVRTISQDAQLTTKQWSDSVLDLSNRFGNTNADVAEGLYQTLSNQIAKGTESFKFMETALSFGQATVTSAADSVNLLSGALKSFQLPASDAERIGAILFKTIELGRVRGKEMADTFGRVGTIAKDAGLKLEEVSAAIAVLTNRGIKFNDASTLVQNIILKLIRPTEEMKKLFAEWGVASGTSAIATFGFAGVLQKLDVEAQKGTTRLGDLLGQIRAIRGAVGLTGGAFNDFNETLGKINNGQGDYDRAKAEVRDSPGKRMERELTQLRNFFQQEGLDFLKGLLVLSDAVGGVTNAVKGLALATGAVTSAYIIWRLASIQATVATVAQAGATAAMATSNGVAATSFYAMAASAGTFLATIGPFAAAFASGYAIGEIFLKGTAAGYDTITFKAKEAEAAALKVREALRKREDQGDDSLMNKANKTQSGAYQAVLQIATAVAKKSEELREKAIANYKSTTEALKVTAGTYFENLKLKMKSFSDAATEAKSLIKASLKESEDLPRRGSEKIFNEKLKYASGGVQDSGTGIVFGDQKAEVTKLRIVELQNRAREEFAKGTTESVAEARKLFNDVERLQTQLFDLTTAKDKKLFDFQVGKGQVGPTGYDSQGKAYYEFAVKTSVIEKEINKTTEERLALEQQFRTQQEARKKAAEEEVLREKERIRALQQQFTLLEKLEVFNKEGKVKKEYAGPEGMEKLLGEFDQRRAKIMELAGGDSEKGLEVFRDLGKQRASLIQQVLQAMRAEGVKQVQEGATRDTQVAERLVTSAREKLTEYRGDAEKLSATLGRQVAVYEQAILKPQQGGSILTGPDKKFAEAEPKRQEAVAALEEVKNAKNAFDAQGGRTAENATKLKLAIDALNQAMLEYVRLRGMNPDETAIRGDKGQTTLTEQARRTGTLGLGIQDTGTGISTAEGQLRGASANGDQMLERFKAMPGALEAMKLAAETNGAATVATFETLKNKASDYAAELERINRALAIQGGQMADRSKSVIPSDANPNFDPEGLMFGGQPKYMSMGGAAGWAPRGSDRVPAMLGEDETVMTGAATKQFAPLLKAMNAGTMPRYMSGGGPVTNVGDITVNVSGGQTDGQSLRNIATGLRREIRRGTISFDK